MCNTLDNLPKYFGPSPSWSHAFWNAKLNEQFSEIDNEIMVNRMVSSNDHFVRKMGFNIIIIVYESKGMGDLTAKSAKTLVGTEAEYFLLWMLNCY